MTTSLHPAPRDAVADDLTARSAATGPDPDAAPSSGSTQVQVPIARSSVSPLGEE